eukprot:g1202.t1
MNVLLITGALGHGALVHPRSRNSVDAFAPNVTDRWTWAPCTNLTAGAACNNGQAAYFYSQGCFIGCPKCDHVSGRRQTDLCGKGFVGKLPTPAIAVNAFFANNDSRVPRDSPFDIYRHNPWRSPGSAPVADPCGLAGGTPWGAAAPEEGEYFNTSHARHGARGSELPALPAAVFGPPARWTVGGTAEVSWTVRFNHGGGYAYRLCPAGEPLSEACFQRTHLEFVQGAQALLLKDGTRRAVPDPVFVSTGTSPPGSMWARLPLPGTGYGHRCACDLTDDAHGDRPQDYSCGCKRGEEHGSCTTPGNCSAGACLPCPETAGSDCSRCDNPPRHAWGRYSFPPPCDAACMGQVGGVVDRVRVPAGLAPGRYVLGWRWDCDASSQIWQNCADIELVRANT